jgi:hypothetical protein
VKPRRSPLERFKRRSTDHVTARWLLYITTEELFNLGTDPKSS